MNTPTPPTTTGRLIGSEKVLLEKFGIPPKTSKKFRRPKKGRPYYKVPGSKRVL